jgi:hypothetical protein
VKKKKSVGSNPPSENRKSFKNYTKKLNFDSLKTHILGITSLDPHHKKTSTTSEHDKKSPKSTIIKIIANIYVIEASALKQI